MEVLKTMFHKMLFGLGLRGFPCHFGDVVCVPGD
jgi:hypothetical protein